MQTITGRVIKGQAYGRKIGFPTANLDRRQYLKDKLNLRFGVYAGLAYAVGDDFEILDVHKAGIVIGPLDKSGYPKIEAHLIGYGGNLYGKKIVLDIKKFLRQFKKYNSEQQLKKAIQADIARIKKLKI